MKARFLEDMQWDHVGMIDNPQNRTFSVSSYSARNNIQLFRVNKPYNSTISARNNIMLLRENKSSDSTIKQPLELPNVINTNPMLMDITPEDLTQEVILNFIGFIKGIFDFAELLFAYPASAIAAGYYHAREAAKTKGGIYWVLCGFMGLLNFCIAGALFRIGNLISGVGEIVCGFISLIPGSGISLTNCFRMMFSGLKKVILEAIVLGAIAIVGACTGGIGNAFMSVISGLSVYSGVTSISMIATATAVTTAFMSAFHFAYRGLKFIAEVSGLNALILKIETWGDKRINATQEWLDSKMNVAKKWWNEQSNTANKSNSENLISVSRNDNSVKDKNEQSEILKLKQSSTAQINSKSGLNTNIENNKSQHDVVEDKHQAKKDKNNVAPEEPLITLNKSTVRKSATETEAEPSLYLEDLDVSVDKPEPDNSAANEWQSESLKATASRRAFAMNVNVL